MKKTFRKLFFVTALMALIAVLFCFGASAETEGYYSYTVKDGKATITDVDAAISGDVTIPSTLGGYSVTAIGVKAFRDCYNLVNITIPDSVITIGDEAFDYCYSLSNITIPDSVITIGDRAFSYCYNLKSVIIGNSVTTIGDEAFFYCESLESVTIGNSVTAIGDEVFSNCNSITSITVSKNNKNYSSDESGVWFNKNKTELIKCPAGNTRTTYTIPDSVITIGDEAFLNCSSLKSVTIGNSVTTIGDYAFRGCESLTSVTISDSVISIGECAFACCTGLTSITIPDSVTSIGVGMLESCEGIVSISLPFVGASRSDRNHTCFGYIFGAYSYLDNEIYVPKNLKEVTITAPCERIDDFAFFNCYSLTKISIPDSVTVIGENALHGCTSLESITLPFIGRSNDGGLYTHFGYIFGENYSPDALYEPEHVPESIKEVILIAPCKKIDSFTFFECANLENITIPNSVTTIGKEAFYHCDSLTSVTIGYGVTTIGSSAFVGCNNLTDVYYTGTREQWNAISIDGFNSELADMTIHYNSCGPVHKNIVEVTEQGPTCDQVGYTAGKYCTVCERWLEGHEEISSFGHTDSNSDSWCDFCEEYCLAELFKTGKCGENVTYKFYKDGMLIFCGEGAMNDYSYYYSSPWNAFQDNIKSVIIDNGVTTIGDRAFYNCSNLTSIIIPDSVTKIGDHAFYYCSGLTSIIIPDDVTAIGTYAFYYCSNLASIKIPDGVTVIEEGTFIGCFSLKNATIPDSITSIEDGAFIGCRSLESVTIPDNVTKIGSSAFEDCDSLISIIIGNKVITIGDYAFYKCKLSNVTIPDSVTTIGDYSFGSCQSLESVIILDGVVTIGDKAFGNCKKLTSVIIPDSVITIGASAFEHCYNIEKVTIGKSVTAIGESAFYACDSLKDVYYRGTEEQWEELSIGSGNGHLTGATIYYNCCAHKNSINIPQQNATFESIGYTAGVYCNDCKKWISGYAVIPKLILGTVQNLKATSKETSITLTWNKVDGAVGYRVFRYDNGWKAMKTTTALTYTATGLSPATNYRFAVRAYTKEGPTVIWAPKYPIISTATAPVPPSMVLQSAGTTNSVTIKWNVCQNTTGYRIYLYNASAKKWETAVKATTKLTVTVSGLAPNTKYYLAVKPYTKTDSGYVWGATYTKILVGTAPTAPTLKVASTAKGRATIAWSDVAGETGYQVYYSTKKDSGYVKLSNYKANTVKVYKTGLTSGKTYYFRVRAYTKVGDTYVYSAFSPVGAVKIK